MNHTVTLLVGGRPAFEYGKPFGPGHKPDCPCHYCASKSRPFENYQDQPDTEHKRLLELRKIPFALPEKREGQ